MSLYEVLKASKAERFPDYWTLLWGRKLSASMIKTITGVLPLTFTAKGGNAFDWTIYGNDDNGTENLLPNVFRQGATNNFISDNRITAVTPILCSVGDTFSVKAEAGFKFAFYLTNEAGYQQFVTDTCFITEYRVYDSGWKTTFTKTVTETQAKCIVIMVAYSDDSNLTPSDATQSITLVKGSTAPDHFIPYQQGVGERTENLFDKSNAEMKGHFYPGSNNKILSYISWGSITIPCEPLTTYTVKKILSTKFYVYTSEDYPVANGDRSDTSNRSDETTVTITSRANDNYLTVSLYSEATDTLTYNEIIDTVVIVEGSTAPATYIPYGYQIPIIISQTGQPDKTVDIYLGDSPLTKGETVSKTSTGQDIELFNGENTVSTTLYNKPDMEIKYK